MVSEEDLRLAMPLIAQSGLPLLVHAELPGPIDQAAGQLAGADMRRYANYLLSRPDSAEVDAIRLIISLCREYGCRVHIVHLSTASALVDLRVARDEGLPITVETCPHYLFFSAEEIADGNTPFKCAPPIREGENRELLWKALQAGEIDLIATDHSPCPPELKQMEAGNFQAAWGGIASVSLALSAVWTAASKRGIALAEVVRWMGGRPAALAGVAGRKGCIAAGLDADFVVFDADASWQVGAGDLHFRHKVSPYVGQHLKGRVQATFLRGECVYRGGQFSKSANGRELQ
jgi:allantoinase